MRTINDLIAARRTLRSGSFPNAEFAGIRKVAAYPMTNSFAVQARFRSLSDKERSFYDTVIVFHELNFVEDKDKDHPFSVEISKDYLMYMEKPSQADTNVMVVCTCADYYWTWWYYNRHKVKAHAWGDLPKPDNVVGVRKFPTERTIRGVTYPAGYTVPQDKRYTDLQPWGHVPGSRNDKRTPGICKHIYTLAEQLKKLGFMKK